jgi:hypothetical protein
MKYYSGMRKEKRQTKTRKRRRTGVENRKRKKKTRRRSCTRSPCRGQEVLGIQAEARDWGNRPFPQARAKALAWESHCLGMVNLGKVC